MTNYTIHSAVDDAIIAASDLEDLDQEVHDLATRDRDAAAGEVRRYYVHVGARVTAAFLTRNGSAQQIPANSFKSSDERAKSARAARDMGK